MAVSVALSPRHAHASGSLPAAQVQECVGGSVVVSFGWIPDGSGAQWIDLSLSDNGFAPGTFVSVGPLSSFVSGFAWSGIAPGRVHYARVNTLSSSGWIPSETSAFVTKDCSFGHTAGLINPRAVYCDAVTLQWAPALPTGQLQWIDLSLQDNGFAPGTFVSVGPFPGAVSSFFWAGLRAGSTHYWRVNTWTGVGWSPSATGTFTTGCGSSGGTSGGNSGGGCSAGGPPNPYGFDFCPGFLIFSPPGDICVYIDCIPNFWNGRGYVIQCSDGMFGKSGGIRGSCSYHGGNSRPLYSH